MNKKFFQGAVALLLLALVIIVSLPNPKPAEAAVSSNTGIITDTTYANVYKGPGKMYGLTGGTVNKGEIVTIHQKTNGWTYVQSNNDYGWIWGEYVLPSSEIGVIAFTTYSNLYKGPGKSHGTTGKIDSGTTVVVFDKKNGWSHVYVNGKEGWVWGEFILPLADSSNIDLETNSDTYKALKSLDAIDDAFIQESFITNAGYVNLYNSAKKADGTKGRLNNGEKVTTFGSKNGWIYVQSDSGEGWVWGTYVTAGPKAGTVVNTTYANIYNGPGKKFGTNGRVDAGTMVEVKELESGWRHFRAGDKEGWIWGEFIETKMEIGSKSLGQRSVICSVNVYKGPGKSYGIIDQLPKGAVVHYYNVHNGWRYVQAGNVQGWIWNEFVEPKATIFLDPGHGGTDSGATGNGLLEKNITLDIGLEAKKLFDKTPFRVLMTRSSDFSDLTANSSKGITSSKSLTLRTDFANANKQSENDVYISIHINSGGGTGGETYVYDLYSKKTGNTYSKESTKLAEYIQKRLVEYMEFKNRGVKQENFAVLRETDMPAVLAEIGFIDNKSDAAKLGDAYWRKQAAKAIYHGTLDYYKDLGFDVSSYY